MPQAGFEPVHGCPYSDLNAARLPVPPLGQTTLIILHYILKNGKPLQTTKRLKIFFKSACFVCLEFVNIIIYFSLNLAWKYGMIIPACL